MAPRKMTPDILGIVMDGNPTKQESNKTVKQEINRRIEQESNSQVKQSQSLDSNHALSTDDKQIYAGLNIPEELKEKATFNLPLPLLRELEDKWMEIRKITGSKQISKTLLVEKALELAFNEFELRKESSHFYTKLVNGKTLKQ